jgi:hypothetical protein
LVCEKRSRVDIAEVRLCLRPGVDLVADVLPADRGRAQARRPELHDLGALPRGERGGEGAPERVTERGVRWIGRVCRRRGLERDGVGLEGADRRQDDVAGERPGEGGADRGRIEAAVIRDEPVAPAVGLGSSFRHTKPSSRATGQARACVERYGVA